MTITTTTKRRELSATYTRIRARLQKAHSKFQSAVYERNPPLDLIKNLVKAVRHANNCSGEVDPWEQKHLNRFLVEASRVDPRILARRCRRRR
jgi:hypothetical protein